MEMIAVRPSRTSSPVRLSSFSLSSFWSRAYLLMTDGQRGAEPLLVGAALGRVDHVRERVHGLAVGGRPLHRDLDRHARRLVAELDDRGVHRLLGGVQVADEVGDAARVLVDDRAGLVHSRLGSDPLVVLGGGDLGRPLVGDRDPQPPVEERGLLHPARQRLEGPVGGLEDPAVRPERRDRPGLIGGLAAVQLPGRGAARVGLGPDVAVLVDLHVKPDRQRVHDRQADAVQSAGDRVGPLVELAARVQRGQHDLDRRAVLDRVLVHRDATAVVDDPDARRRPAASPGCRSRSPPGPRRPSCPQPRRPGGAARARRSSRCTCRDAYGRPQDPRVP